MTLALQRTAVKGKTGIHPLIFCSVPHGFPALWKNMPKNVDTCLFGMIKRKKGF
jgi:hypothetical protein